MDRVSDRLLQRYIDFNKEYAAKGDSLAIDMVSMLTELQERRKNQISAAEFAEDVNDILDDAEEECCGEPEYLEGWRNCIAHIRLELANGRTETILTHKR